MRLPPRPALVMPAQAGIPEPQPMRIDEVTDYWIAGSSPAMTSESTSGPLLTERFEPGVLQVIGAHHRSKPASGIELQEEGLGEFRYLRGVGDIDHQYRGSLPVLLGKLDCLGLRILKHPLHELSNLAAPNQRVERLVRKNRVE